MLASRGGHLLFRGALGLEELDHALLMQLLQLRPVLREVRVPHVHRHGAVVDLVAARQRRVARERLPPGALVRAVEELAELLQAEAAAAHGLHHLLRLQPLRLGLDLDHLLLGERRGDRDARQRRRRAAQGVVEHGPEALGVDLHAGVAGVQLLHGLDVLRAAAELLRHLLLDLLELLEDAALARELLAQLLLRDVHARGLDLRSHGPGDGRHLLADVEEAARELREDRQQLLPLLVAQARRLR
mmetsp:Transcript_16092/g.41619  ORF Transcript_16092/g.41619 Transcript_16092/m.41619 type:complete len:244 (-) Transcript_16092:25-756(-)